MKLEIALIDDDNYRFASFVNDADKVRELNRKLNAHEPLNDEELWVQLYVSEWKTKIINTWKQVWDSIRETAVKFVETLSALFSMEIKASDVLTSRQYYLMLHGKPRVRKKWFNIAQRRIRYGLS